MKQKSEYMLLAEKISLFYQTNRNQYQNLKETYQRRVVREMYSSGGLIMRRGYLCPSLVQDITIGGSNRGRLLKSQSIGKKAGYVYGYDSENRLIYVKKHENAARNHYILEEEFLFYQENVVLSAVFVSPNIMPMLRDMTRCVYEDGLLMRYDVAIPDYTNANRLLHLLESERYSYKNGRLESCIMETYAWPEKLVGRHGYCFSHDEEGNICSFTSQQYAGDNLIHTLWSDRVYEVSKSKQKHLHS